MGSRCLSPDRVMPARAAYISMSWLETLGRQLRQVLKHIEPCRGTDDDEGICGSALIRVREIETFIRGYHRSNGMHDRLTAAARPMCARPADSATWAIIVLEIR